MLKALGLLTPLLFGGLYAGGVFSGGGYSREVARPEADVMRALADLDVTAHGSPDISPSRSGGVKPLFRLERGEHSMRWLVMSGDKVATTMTAEFQPLDGGKTRVTAHVERGDAPDDFVSPAFRSNSVTLGLFSMALESELNDLTRPVAASAEACAKLVEDFHDGNLANGLNERPDGLKGAVGQVGKSVIRLQAFDAEQRRMGCGQSGGEPPFAMMREEMKPAESTIQPGQQEYVPGQPMLDPTPATDRPVYR